MKAAHYLRKISPYAVIGLEGICANEPAHVRRSGKAYGYSLWVVAIGLLLQWHYETFNYLTVFQLRAINMLVWLYLLLTFSYFCYYVENKVRYICSNWLLPLVILLGVPTLFLPIAWQSI